MGLLVLDTSAAPVAPAPESPVASAYGRMMKALLPPGKLWRLFDSLLSALFLACGDELARVEARAIDLLNEADPTTTTELLPEYERELALTAATSLAERRANVVARLIRRQRFRPVDFQAALADLLAQAPEDVVVIERTRAFCIAIEDDREIFRFFIYRDPSLPGAYFLASAQVLVDEMKPSHTIGQVIESVSARYGDPHSLYGRDLMGG
jgi:uncharacterized protein YmfQ (DUF2313 family)